MTNTVANALATISGDIYAMRDQFDAALIDRSINFEREAGFAIQQISSKDYTLKCAMGNRQSVVDAVTNIAAIGISLNPAKKQAYLVPRDGKICLDISYMGLLDLAIDSGSIMWGQSRLVHEADAFELNGLDRLPDHKYKPFAKDRGPVVGVYVTVKTRHGDYLTDTMSYEDCLAIRDRSQAWKSSKSGPWKTDEGEMIKKTVIKRAYKLWPKSDRLDEAIHHLNTDNGEGLAELATQAATATSRLLLGGPTGAASGIGDDLPGERKQIVEAVANAVIDLFNGDDLVGAYGEYIGIEDNDEKTYLWRKLPSNIRTALKKHGESLKPAAEAA